MTKKQRIGCLAYLVIFLGLPLWLQYRPSIPWAYRPLFEATKAGDANRVEALLRQGLNPNVQPRRPLFDAGFGNIQSRTPLHYAAAAGDILTIEALLRGGANPNTKASIGGDPPLEMVVRSARIEHSEGKLVSKRYIAAARVLIDNGALAQGMGGSGMVALSQAAAFPDTALLAQLLRLDYPPSVIAAALNVAVKAGRPAAVQLLSEKAGEASAAEAIPG